MKKSTSLIAVLIVVLVLLCGCNSDSGSPRIRPNPPSDPVVDPTPRINSVDIIVNGVEVYPYEVNWHDEIVFSVSFTDRNLDVRNLYIQFYNELDGYVAIQEEIELLTPPVRNQTFVYTFYANPYIVPGYASGYWKLVAFCVDEEGNESGEFEKYYLVREGF